MSDCRRVPVPLCNLANGAVFYLTRNSNLLHTVIDYNAQLHVTEVFDGFEKFNLSPNLCVWIEDTLVPY